jgi:hypothetical protein
MSSTSDRLSESLRIFLNLFIVFLQSRGMFIVVTGRSGEGRLAIICFVLIASKPNSLKLRAKPFRMKHTLVVVELAS